MQNNNIDSSFIIRAIRVIRGSFLGCNERA
jgi:hypothetical protein